MNFCALRLCAGGWRFFSCPFQDTIQHGGDGCKDGHGYKDGEMGRSVNGDSKQNGNRVEDGHTGS